MATDRANEITFSTAEKLGINKEEFEKIKEILGRVPNFTELSIFSVMWSEHCSYKNSIKYLKTLPRDGSRMLVAAGEENAGLIDIGDGLACAFKIESHNHPSAVEPYQGAATGVGGIHRDIFTMGARPIAALNSLRFGNINNKRTQHLLNGVVKGIGDYGNSFGVPTVGGEIYFEDCYQINPLVNAMSVGIVEIGKTVSAISKGVGNPVYIVGSATGKDGIAGAAFASKDIGENAMDDLPAVQVGDPFQEKLLLEASLEAIKTGAIVGMQDMGAAGITCSTSEMSEKGEHGMNVFLDEVPLRQKDMKDWEILLSESQERMLIVLEKGNEAAVIKVFEKWDLNCVKIGEVTAGNTLNYFYKNEKVAEVPAPDLCLGGGAPIYDRSYTEPEYFKNLKNYNEIELKQPKDFLAITKQLIQLPNIASKKYVYEQYDSMVGIKNMSTNMPTDAALVRVPNTNKALAVTVDCNARFVYADPYIGAMIAVAEAARNIVCSGATPLAITNCLNFGNPYNENVYWQFVNAIKGMGEACTALNTPVTGGNVSFYNQSSDEGPVYPTPTIGMVGLLNDKKQALGLSFKNENDLIYLLGNNVNDLNNSEYLVRLKNINNSKVPYFNLQEAINLNNMVLKLNEANLLQSAHDISDGGLITCLLESSFYKNKGFEISNASNLKNEVFLFGEAQSRVVVSIEKEAQQQFEALLTEKNYPFLKIGKVTENEVYVNNENWEKIEAWEKLYNEAIENLLV